MVGILLLLFFKGALLKDPDDLLAPQGLTSIVGYRIGFTNVEGVLTAAISIKDYVQEAVEIEKAGVKVEVPNDFKYPGELTEKFDSDPDYQTAFNSLSPGRQRGCIMHFSDAQQSKKRTARIERCRQKNLCRERTTCAVIRRYPCRSSDMCSRPRNCLAFPPMSCRYN